MAMKSKTTPREKIGEKGTVDGYLVKAELVDVKGNEAKGIAARQVGELTLIDDKGKRFSVRCGVQGGRDLDRFTLFAFTKVSRPDSFTYTVEQDDEKMLAADKRQ